MIFDEYKKPNNNRNKTLNITQSEPKQDESDNTNMIYKKYKSSNIFEKTKSNNAEIWLPAENTLSHVRNEIQIF